MKKRPELPMLGGCQCGKLRYRIDGKPLTAYACHCLECQRQSSSAFGLSTWVNASDFRFEQGEPAFYFSTGGSGAAKAGAYCADCGTRIYHRGGGSAGRDGELEGQSGILSLKGGSLDDVSWFYPIAHLWTVRTHSWILDMIAATDFSPAPAPKLFEREPEDDDELAALWDAYQAGL